MKPACLFVIVLALYTVTEAQARFCGVPCPKRADCSNLQRGNYSNCGICSCSDKYVISCPRPIPCERGCRLSNRRGCNTCLCYR